MLGGTACTCLQPPDRNAGQCRCEGGWWGDDCGKRACPDGCSAHLAGDEQVNQACGGEAACKCERAADKAGATARKRATLRTAADGHVAKLGVEGAGVALLDKA